MKRLIFFHFFLVTYCLMFTSPLYADTSSTNYKLESEAQSGGGTFSITSTNTLEGTVSPSSLTFTSTNWNTSRTVTVTGQDDLVQDGNISYAIILGAATSNDSKYQGDRKSTRLNSSH